MNNEIKNTLFRFVNFRAPELISDLEKHPGFVVYVKPDQNAKLLGEDLVIAAGSKGSKLNALKTAATNFGATAKKVGDIKAFSADLYVFSEWLSKNRFKATEVEIQTKATDSKLKVTAVTNFDMKLLWDNLIYQVVTQNDYYVKELLMQYLLALHVIKNTGIGTYKERALAKVVLPEYLFVENSIDETPEASGIKEFLSPNLLFQSHDGQALAQQNIKLLNTLQEELELAEEQYQKEFQLAQATAFEAHQATPAYVAEMLRYETELDNTKKTWIATRNPAIVFNPADPSHQIPDVKPPKFPKFVFTAASQMDDSFLIDVLSEQSYNVYHEILHSTDDDDDALDEINVSKIAAGFRKVKDTNRTFATTKEVIKKFITANSNFLSKKTVDLGSTSLIIGGTTLQMLNTQSPLLPFECEIKTRRTSTFFKPGEKSIQLMLGLPDEDWKVTLVEYKMTKTNNTFIVKKSSQVEHYSGYDVMLDLSMGGIDENLKELSLTFQFLNGKTGTLKITNFDLNKVYNGKVVLPLELLTTFPAIRNSTVAPEKHFIPSGFGVKNIGVAEYNKVEQSIQGYVEGEVAHIENIMAREFKEKSTRRLRRKEETQTLTSETEREQLTDTSTVDRFEMQSEVAKVIASSKDFNGGVNATYGNKAANFEISAMANYASNNTKEESTRMAVTQAKEITERALDRIVSKVKEERIEKIVEEFEENNTHGFDNRKGDQHVVGVYRWVDKVYKNQIVNYGKRMMYEFAIPEPARLHNLGMSTLVDENKAKALPFPQDPRTSRLHKLTSFSDLDDTRLKHWTGVYNVEFTKKPDELAYFGKSISIEKQDGPHESVSKSDSIKIDEKYVAKRSFVVIAGHEDTDANQAHVISVLVGDTSISLLTRLRGVHTTEGTFSNVQEMSNIRGEVPFSIQYYNYHTGVVNVTVECKLSVEALAQWQQETFNAIIKGYEKALEKYNEALAVETANGVQILGSNPGFYREIENIILRKNCISYLISSNPNSKLTFGKDFYKKNNSESTLHFGNAMINNTADLDSYAALVKFIEQAFEWDIMSYYFYPFYWGNRSNWVSMYQYDQTHDPLFKAFMQSGMARVIVTVRPGFEEAVRYYMQTGQIWMGGEVPVIGDKLYQSIVDEMRKTEGEKVGMAWPTRVPTSMTILQAESIGLTVESALPFDTEGLKDFEFPDEVPQSKMFVQNEAQVGIEQRS
ncbi:hypothetical protein J2X31_002516 [Flavobacterium arsenatis]|uniref:Uncharacterized protein n=1 Tax=Flavobacterium arsenatis TaxID=1484332 RepID=A0ABU1TRJ9_9FLAO|nr:hypothetical protein [Flavobacterium arsenatis]MDR6968493.1 hypothetical protein [Flavobacterium arsenatis]